MDVGRYGHLLQQAIDAPSHPQMRTHGLEMQIRGLFAQALVQQIVQPSADAVVGFGYSGGSGEGHDDRLSADAQTPLGFDPNLPKSGLWRTLSGLPETPIMQIQSRPPIERSNAPRPMQRVEDRRTEEALADRRIQEQNAADQRRQAELQSTRRAQLAQNDKGRRVDRYA